MNGSLFKLFSDRNLKRLLFSVHSFTFNMVRYFPNPFEDYITGTTIKIEKELLINQINDHITDITKRLLPTRKNVDGGLYVGVTGVSYMFYYLSKNSNLSEFKATYLDKAQEYLKPALESSAGDKTSFLLGDAGTYALATVLGKERGDENYTESLKQYKSLLNQYLTQKFLKCGGDELFVGRAGYLAGALWLNRELKTQVFDNKALYSLCDMMVASGKEYSEKHRSPCPLMYHYYNTEYIGAAHGISFILQMLLSVPGYLEHNHSAAKDIKETVDFVTALQSEDGNWPCCMEEIPLGNHELVHWCHGAPGTVYLMARAFVVYKDRKYLDACIKAAEHVWHKGLLRKGPGICHGVAGNGYVFLLLYRLTNDKKYLYRAKSFAEFMKMEEFVQEARLPDNPQSLYEGFAGTVCFLNDLLVPNTAEFPFQNVFT